MYKGGSKLLPVVLVVIVTIVAIIALVSVGRALLGKNTQNAVVEESPAAQSLLVADVDRSVRMTVRGPIVASEDFSSYQIEISPIERRMTTYKGYEQQVIDTKKFSNSSAGYVEFVHALDRVHFTKEAQLTGDLGDVRGICATGRLYTFAILQAQSVTKELWVSSCRNVQGTFKGDAVPVRDLFLKQIPDNGTLLQGLSL